MLNYKSIKPLKKKIMSTMFCSQCQETAKNTGCTVVGVCGKTSDVANLQDLFIYTMKAISKVNQCLRDKGKNLEEVDFYVLNGLL